MNDADIFLDHWAGKLKCAAGELMNYLVSIRVHR